MELYTIEFVNGEEIDYRRDQIIDEYESLIWTERFIEPGDFQLVLPASHRNAVLTRPNTLVGINTSREICLVESREIKDGSITAKGRTIEAFFDQRPIEEQEIGDNTADLLRRLVEQMQERDEGYFAIPGLRIGLTADTFDLHLEKIATGTVHATLLGIAQKGNVGMAVYWVKEDDGRHELAFSTRVGEDRSDEIIFSPALDNFANVSELYSVLESKSVIIAPPPKELAEEDGIAEGMEPVQISNNGDFETNPFEKRYGVIDTDDITLEQLSGADDEEKRNNLRDLMYDKATKALMAAKKDKIVDGEITLEAQYSYYNLPGAGADLTYRLGDTVRVAGDFTDPVKAVITEFIQTSDAAGSRSYPTVVIPADEIPSSPT